MTEFALQTSLAWLGKTVQPRMIAVVPSPVKQRTSQAPAPVESRKRGRVSWDDDDGNGPPPPVLLTFVVSKYNTQLLGATRSILLRSVTLRVDRFRWFPMAFSHGLDSENVALYQESSNILKAAEDRIQKASGLMGVRDVLRTRGVCFWGKQQADVEFMAKLTLWNLGGFDDADPCIPHSGNVNTVRQHIKNCRNQWVVSKNT